MLSQKSVTHVTLELFDQRIILPGLSTMILIETKNEVPKIEELLRVSVLSTVLFLSISATLLLLNLLLSVIEPKNVF